MENIEYLHNYAVTKKKGLYKGKTFTVEDLYKLEGQIAERTNMTKIGTGATLAFLGTTALAAAMNVKEEMGLPAVLTVVAGVKTIYDSAKLSIDMKLYDELKERFDAINQVALAREEIAKEKNKEEFKKNCGKFIIEEKDDIIARSKQTNLLSDTEIMTRQQRMQKEALEEKQRELEALREEKVRRELEVRQKDNERMQEIELNYHKAMLIEEEKDELAFDEYHKGRKL